MTRHLLLCPNKPKDLIEQSNRQPIIEEKVTSTVSCGEINHSTVHISPTTHNSPTTNNDHSVNHNHYYINLYPDLSHKRVHNLFATKLSPEYISQGETGLYEFIFCEIFTDPTNPNKTAIMCVNYKEEIFHYGMLDDKGQPVIREDISLSEFNRYLHNFDGLIHRAIHKSMTHIDGLLNATSEDTKKNLDALVDAMTSRKKMPSYIADKIRSIKPDNTPLSRYISPKIIESWTDELEKNGQMAYQTHVPTERELKAKEELKIRDRLLTPEKIAERQARMERGKKKVMKKVNKHLGFEPKKLRIKKPIEEETSCSDCE